MTFCASNRRADHLHQSCKNFGVTDGDRTHYTLTHNQLPRHPASVTINSFVLSILSFPIRQRKSPLDFHPEGFFEDLCSKHALSPDNPLGYRYQKSRDVHDAWSLFQFLVWTDVLPVCSLLLIGVVQHRVNPKSYISCIFLVTY